MWVPFMAKAVNVYVHVIYLFEKKSFLGENFFFFLEQGSNISCVKSNELGILS